MRWWIPLALIVLHAIALVALRELDVVSQMLGTAAPKLAVAALLAAFYVLRLVVFFVCPAWLVLSLLRASRLGRSRSPASPSSAPAPLDS